MRPFLGATGRLQPNAVYHSPCKPCKVFAAYYRAPQRAGRSLITQSPCAIRTSLQPVSRAQDTVTAPVKDLPKMVRKSLRA